MEYKDYYQIMGVERNATQAVRATYPANPDGAEVMLECWLAGSEEPTHSHPGDDMTVVVEGKMAIQFYTKSADGLVADGERLS